MFLSFTSLDMRWALAGVKKAPIILNPVSTDIKLTIPISVIFFMCVAKVL